MAEFDPRRLLDLPSFPADGYAKLADRLAAILGTHNDVLLIQGEAIVALEAVAKSVASRRIRALNVVTSPYGRLFGQWMRQGDAEVTDLVAEPGKPVTIEAFAAAFDADPAANLVSLVHAESATGILNPLPEIVALARRRGALLVVDAVASVGGHELDVDALGIDICVIGPQKSLGGSPGLSALSISERAWLAIDDGGAPAASILSLTDLKESWLDKGRSALPGMPSALEFFALQAALDRVEAEGMPAVIARHKQAAQSTRDGVRALGLNPWVADANASNLVTGVLLPDGVTADALLSHPAVEAAKIERAVGDFSGELIRLNHTGQRGSPETVAINLQALASALERSA